ncbi:helix-turn-helix domain-containing protein (plasmid) [Microtetraspora malaysiensis]|uniref:helix-turn-helix domain-containing protein n=1 Tax=Microtetraspora malaysiensis TaxID=161358 RepID=UPI003D928114
MIDASTEPGARLRELRKRRGLTQEELAEQAGLSLAVIKKIEQGGTARMETYRQIAQVLGVQTVWFVSPGSPRPTTDTGDDTVLAEMRSAVTPPIGFDGSPILGTADYDDIALPRLRDAAVALGRAYHADRYDDLAHLLPALVRSAHYHVLRFDDDGDDRAEAYRLRSAVLGLAGRYLIQVRAHDLALISLQRAQQDALVIGDMPLAAAAMSSQAWAMLRQGRFWEVEQLCAQAADRIEPRMSTATTDEVAAWGKLLMRASAGAVRNNRPEEANEYLTLAETAATRVGREHMLAGQFAFGPLSAALQRPENAMIEGRPDVALEAMANLPRGVGRTNSSTRNRARLDEARALIRMGDADKATDVMAGLRHTAPEWLRYQQAARDVTSEIVESRTRTLSNEQRNLVDFLDVED